MFGFRMARTIPNPNIRKQTFKMFGIRMDSEFQWIRNSNGFGIRMFGIRMFGIRMFGIRAPTVVSSFITFYQVTFKVITF